MSFNQLVKTFKTKQSIVRNSKEAGFTLVELLVSMVLGGIVLGLIATLLINSLKVQNQTLSTTFQSQDLQVHVHSIERNIRNSKEAYVNDLGDLLALSSFTGEAEDIINGNMGSNWGCLAFYITTEGSLLFTNNANAVSSAVGNNKVNLNDEGIPPAGWRVLLKDLNIDSDNFFQGEKRDNENLLANYTSGDSINFKFSLKTKPGLGDAKDVVSTSSVTLRPQVNGGSSCW